MQPLIRSLAYRRCSISVCERNEGEGTGLKPQSSSTVPGAHLMHTHMPSHSHPQPKQQRQRMPGAWRQSLCVSRRLHLPLDRQAIFQAPCGAPAHSQLLVGSGFAVMCYLLASHGDVSLPGASSPPQNPPLAPHARSCWLVALPQKHR